MEQTRFEDAPIMSIHRRITAGTFMGQLSDGYTLGIVGIALSYAQGPLGLTSFWMGILAAASYAGILFGCLFAGMICDRIGRRPLYSSVMFFLIAIRSTVSSYRALPSASSSFPILSCWPRSASSSDCWWERITRPE